MTRHSKNNSAGAVFTHHERLSMSGGTARLRLSSESVRPFSHCCLCLQQATPSPVVTPRGFLYHRACILENLLAQRQTARAVSAKADARAATREEETSREAREKEEERVRAFEEREHGLGKRRRGGEGGGVGRRVVARAEGKEVGARVEEGSGGLKGNFWLPSNTPDAGNGEAGPRPDGKTRCPMDKDPLKMKDLVGVEFSKGDDGVLICAVCSRSLSNSVKCAALKGSGTVLCSECLNRFVMTEERDPITNAKLNPARDVIRIQSGGTGFAASGGERKVVSQYNPSIRV